MSHPSQLSDQEQRRLSEEVILALNAAIQVIRYHSSDNDAASAALIRMQDALKVLLAAHYQVSVLFYSHDFYVNEVRVRPSAATFELFENLAARLAERGVGTIDVHSLPRRQDLASLVSALFDEPTHGATPDFELIVKRLEEARVTSLSLQPHVTVVPENLPEIEKGEFVRQAFFKGILSMEALYKQASERRPLAIKTATRVVQNFVDVFTHTDHAHSDTLILLTRIKNYRSYAANHAVNTAVMAIAFGHEIGIGRAALRELGLAAILADIGSSILPDAVLEGAGRLNQRSVRAVVEHPIRGTALVVGFQHLNELVVAAGMACAEHHRGPVGGYPGHLPPPAGINAHVIAVCDRYDALTTARPYRPQAMTPAAALETLVEEAGDRLDRPVVDAFLWWQTGLPAGEVVRKDDGGLDLIVHPPPADLRRHLEALSARLK